MPVPLKQAVANAIGFATEALDNRAQGVQLEEVESVDTNGTGVWLITLSMTDHPPSSATSPMLDAYLNRRRDYKIFTVRKDTGEVIAMKIREFGGE
ncbi:MAG: hypothetical protein ABSE42_13425 [Bryobacteraceae bacterium]|jgi:hypothetical protein